MLKTMISRSHNGGFTKLSRSTSMKKYWSECNNCDIYHNGKKVHKRQCYDCGEGRTMDGKRLFSEIYGIEALYD